MSLIDAAHSVDEAKHRVLSPYSIEDVILENGTVRISWADGAVSHFHYVWLRDNCLCESCGDPAVGRKMLRITSIPEDVQPSEISFDTHSLKITWAQTGHHSDYQGHWLREHAYEEQSRRERRFRPKLWDRRYLASPPELTHDQVVGSDVGLHTLLETVRDFGLCFVRDVPPEVGELEAFASRIGPIQESNFGRILDLVIDPSKKSIANSNKPLVVHTDEPYRASPPGILMFHCFETCSSGGGQSTFVDGFKIAEILRDEDAQGFEVLTKRRQAFRRNFVGDVDLQSEFPVISVDEFGSIVGVRVNDRVAAPLSIEHRDVPTFYRAYRRLLQLLDDPQYTISRTLQPGDLAVFDNHRILHGRTGMEIKSRRRLRWCQVERGDFFSALRITGRKIGKEHATRMLRGAYS